MINTNSPQDAPQPRFQILSLIGGGIRGAFITAFLNRIEQKLQRPIADCFDLVAGTSTGAIIAAGLASGMSAEEVHRFYVDYGASIFTPRPPHRAKGAMRFVFPMANWVFKRRNRHGLDAAFRARFCPHALQYAFDKGFGDRTLGMIERTRLIIPAVNLTKGEPYSFRSRHLPRGVHDKDIKISDAITASTAAPTYFPHKQIGENAYVDGGMWAADPSVLAFAEAMRIQQFEREIGQEHDLRTEHIHLLSVGTGRAQFSLAPPGADAGLLYWAPRVADVMTTSQVQGIHLPLRFLLGERYMHVNFSMKEQWDLDAFEHIPALFATGEQRAEELFDRLHGDLLTHQSRQFLPCSSTEGEINMDEFGFA